MSNRLLYKVSGESLGGYKGLYDKLEMQRICKDIKDLHNNKFEICIVVGGGNILRGRSVNEIGIQRLSGDYMGMLATVMNALAIQSVLEESFKKDTVVMSAINIDKACERYDTRAALKALKEKKIVIFAAGIGSPFFSTDTGAAVRAIEMNCDLFVKGTTVDGVYSADPKINKNAKFYNAISYDEVIQKNLSFIDRNAAELLMQHDIKSLVFSIKSNKSPLCDLFFGNTKHTLIQNK